MTTYQKGHEPAGAPVTCTRDASIKKIVDGLSSRIGFDIQRKVESEGRARLAYMACCEYIGGHHQEVCEEIIRRTIESAVANDAKCTTSEQESVK